MKKKSIIAILLTLVMCFALSACGGSAPTDTEIKVGVPFTMNEGEEYTFTGIRGGMHLSGSQINLTFKIDVEAVNNSGDESLLDGMSWAKLYDPDGQEITLTGDPYLSLGDTACGFNSVLDGSSKSYSMGYLNPEKIGEYKLIYTDGMEEVDYTFTFTLDEIAEDGNVTITYPTADGTETYKSDIANGK